MSLPVSAAGRERVEVRERGHRQVLESDVCARLRILRIFDLSGARSRFRSRGATPVRGPPLEPALVICRGAAAASPWKRRFPMTVRIAQRMLHSSLARSGVLSTMLSSASADDNGGGGEGKSGKQTSSGRIRRGLFPVSAFELTTRRARRNCSCWRRTHFMTARTRCAGEKCVGSAGACCIEWCTATFTLFHTATNARTISALQER
jgi:hypothetical protein